MTDDPSDKSTVDIMVRKPRHSKYQHRYQVINIDTSINHLRAFHGHAGSVIKRIKALIHLCNGIPSVRGKPLHNAKDLPGSRERIAHEIVAAQHV